jgi:hypothetical protein
MKWLAVFLLVSAAANADVIRVQWDGCTPDCTIYVNDKKTVQQFDNPESPLLVAVAGACYRVDICSPQWEFDDYTEQITYNRARCKWTRWLSKTDGKPCK